MHFEIDNFTVREKEHMKIHPPIIELPLRRPGLQEFSRTLFLVV